ncbi:hypothetical protein PR048_004108 [Dryococelus australis]|uniref:Uncharacterized protein n=1 Tax=Dryococelus australis TaxID=614101 RepID=A0ABQ9I5L0_9NEOP|nr:hypothetical protein PR048_004108 [Dryococelus australis]
MLGFLCLPIKVVRRRPEDRLPYVPLYAAALNVGTETYTAIVVFQHVEKDFLKELYAEREKYWAQHICISPFENRNTLTSTDNANGKLKSSCETLPPTKTKLLEGNLSDHNLSKVSVEISQIRDKDKIPVSKDNSKAENTVYLKGGSREGSGSESVKRNVVVDNNSVNQGNIISRFGPQLLEYGTTKKIDCSTLPKEEQNKVECVPVMHLGDAQPYRCGMQASISRGVHAQLCKPSIVQVMKVSPPPRDVQDVEADLPEEQGCPELVVLTDDIRANRLVQKVISEDRNTKMVVPRFSTTFTDDIVPPGTEDSESLLQERESKMDQDIIDVQGVSGSDETIEVVHEKAAGALQGKIPRRVRIQSRLRFKIQSQLYKISGNIRGNYENVGHISYKRPTKLLSAEEGWYDDARYRWGMQDAARSPGSNKFYGLGVRHRPHFTGDAPEAFPLMKDGVQFDTRVGTDENKRATFEELRDMRYTGVNLHGRSFDDAELQRRARPRIDDVASGIMTDVHSMNIRTGGWNFRDDIHNRESIHDGFEKLNACKGSNLLEFNDLYQHERKTAPAIDRSFPHVSDKCTFSEWFALNDKSRPMIGDAEINRAMISMPEDRNRTAYERNTLSLVTESKNQMQQHMFVGESSREKYGEFHEQGSLHSAGISHSSCVSHENASVPKKALEKVHHIPVLNSRRLESGVKQAKTERKRTLVSSQQNTYHPYGAASSVQTLSTDFIPSGVDSHVDRAGLHDAALPWINTSSQGRLESAQGPYNQNFVVAQPGTVHQPPQSWGMLSAPQLPFHADAHRSVVSPVQDCIAISASFPGIIPATGGMMQTSDVGSSVSQWVSPLHRSDERVIQGWQGDVRKLCDENHVTPSPHVESKQWAPWPSRVAGRHSSPVEHRSNLASRQKFQKDCIFLEDSPPARHRGNSVEASSATSFSLAPRGYSQVLQQFRTPDDIPSSASASTISPGMVRPFSDVSRSGMFS